MDWENKGSLSFQGWTLNPTPCTHKIHTRPLSYRPCPGMWKGMRNNSHKYPNIYGNIYVSKFGKYQFTGPMSPGNYKQITSWIHCSQTNANHREKLKGLRESMYYIQMNRHSIYGQLSIRCNGGQESIKWCLPSAENIQPIQSSISKNTLHNEDAVTLSLHFKTCGKTRHQKSTSPALLRKSLSWRKRVSGENSDLYKGMGTRVWLDKTDI